MTKITKILPGEFCWADLGTPDLAATKKFYSKIFGWKSFDNDMGPNGVYSMQQLEKKNICAIHTAGDPMAGKKKPFWMPYIAVKSVDQSLKKAKTAGATIHMGAHDVPGAGRMAILSDPTGASFAIWEARGSIGTQLKQLPGTVCWHDLSTPDRAGAIKFYSKVFGWKVQIQDFSGNAYYLLKLAGKRAGLGGIWPQPLPGSDPAWFTYCVVKSCARTVTQAKRLGGKVVLGPITVPKTCTFAIIEDPQGAAFGALQPLD